MWYSQVSPTNTLPRLFCSTQRAPQTIIPYPSFAVVSTGLPWHFFVLHFTHTCKAFMQHAHQRCTVAWSNLCWRWLDSFACQTTLLVMHASVNSLASFHAVRATAFFIFLASLYIFHTVQLPNLELVVHSHTIFCQLVLVVFWSAYQRGRSFREMEQVQMFRSSSFLCISSTQMLLDPCEQVSLIPWPIQVRSGYEANYNQRYIT